jgi:prophage regulatory protein
MIWAHTDTEVTTRVKTEKVIESHRVLLDRLLRLPEVMRVTGMRRVTIWRNERAGKFPRRVRLGIRAIGWRESEISRWIAERPTVATTPSNLRASAADAR